MALTQVEQQILEKVDHIIGADNRTHALCIKGHVFTQRKPVSMMEARLLIKTGALIESRRINPKVPINLARLFFYRHRQYLQVLYAFALSGFFAVFQGSVWAVYMMQMPQTRRLIQQTLLVFVH